MVRQEGSRTTGLLGGCRQGSPDSVIGSVKTAGAWQKPRGRLDLAGGSGWGAQRNQNFIAFSRYSGLRMDGQAIAVFVIVLAAAEAAIALAIVLNIYHRFNTINVDEISKLKE